MQIETAARTARAAAAQAEAGPSRGDRLENASGIAGAMHSSQEREGEGKRMRGWERMHAEFKSRTDTRAGDSSSSGREGRLFVAVIGAGRQEEGRRS